MWESRIIFYKLTWTPKFGLLLGADSLKTTKLGHVEEELELLILLS